LQNKALLISLFWLSFLPLSKSQIGNYVSNGSFEDYYVCNGIYYPISNSKNWLSIDSTSYAGDFSGVCSILGFLVMPVFSNIHILEMYIPV
jgi:hypothetical protein